MNCRSNFLGKLFVPVLLLLAGFYYWFYDLEKFSSFRHLFHQSQFFQKSFALEQNGEYWILNDFILAGSSRYGNQSITLTTHGTYRDLKYLEYLVVRWNAPISLALFVRPGDFETILSLLYDLKYCSVSGLGFSRWVSVQLVMHQDHIPQDLRKMEAEPPNGFRCGVLYEIEKGNVSIPQSRDLKYPLHLLKNVARLNAKTYYVFPLELNALPATNFAVKFLRFVKLQDLPKPQRSVYCVPIFPQLGEKIYLLKYKSDLVDHLKSYLNGSHPLSFSQLKQLKDMEFWLNSDSDEVGVLRVEKSHQNCTAHVAINAYEPFYDQRFTDLSYAKKSSQLQVLTGLKFNFVLLNGVFLIHRHREPETSYSRNALPPAKPNQILGLIKLNSLALK